MITNAHVGMVLNQVKTGSVPCKAKCKICGEEVPYYKTNDGKYLTYCRLHGFVEMERRNNDTQETI